MYTPENLTWGERGGGGGVRNGVLSASLHVLVNVMAEPVLDRNREIYKFHNQSSE